MHQKIIGPRCTALLGRQPLAGLREHPRRHRMAVERRWPPSTSWKRTHSCLAHPALAQICRSSLKNLKIGVWSVDAGVQKTAFERQVNGESFMSCQRSSGMKHWRLLSVHGVAKVVNTVARLPGNADSHELRILQLLTWWCWERSPTRQSFHQIMEGNKHTHTPIHYCLRSSEALVHGVIGVFEICIANSKVLQPLWSLPSWILRPICQLVGIEIRLRHHRSSAHYSFGSQSRCWGHLGLDLAVPGWDVGVYWTDNENAFEPWQTTSQPLLKLLLFSDSSRSCGL